MRKFLISFQTEMTIEARNEDEALDMFWEEVMTNGVASLDEIEDESEVD